MCALCSEPLGPDPKQDREMKSHCQSQTLSPTRPTRPFAISGIIIVIISGSGRVGLECLYVISIPDASFPSIWCIFNGSSSYRTHFNVAPFNGFVFGSHHHHLWLSLWLWPQWKCYKYACDLVCAIWFGFPNTPKSWLKVKLLCHFGRLLTYLWHRKEMQSLFILERILHQTYTYWSEQFMAK